METSTLSSSVSSDLRDKIRKYHQAIGLSVVNQTDEQDEYQDEYGRTLCIGERLEAETNLELPAIVWVTKLLSQLNKLLNWFNRRQ